MKHLPSLLDYLLVLDYGVSKGEATTAHQQDTGPTGTGVSAEEGYLWLQIEDIMYKTPFKSIAFAGMLPKKAELEKMMNIWAFQYDLVSRSLPISQSMNSKFCSHYPQALLEYVLSLVFITQSLSTFQIRFEDFFEGHQEEPINVPLKMTSSPIIGREFYSAEFLVNIPLGYWTAVPINGPTVITVKGTDVSAIFGRLNERAYVVIGCYVNPDSLVIPTIDQLVNTSNFGRVKAKDSRTNTEVPQEGKYYIRFVPAKIAVYKKIEGNENELRQELIDSLRNKLKDTLIPYCFYTTETSSIVIEDVFITLLDNITNKVPQFYDESFPPSGASVIRTLKDTCKYFERENLNLGPFLKEIRKGIIAYPSEKDQFLRAFKEKFVDQVMLSCVNEEDLTIGNENYKVLYIDCDVKPFYNYKLSFLNLEETLLREGTVESENSSKLVVKKYSFKDLKGLDRKDNIITSWMRVAKTKLAPIKATKGF